MQDDIVLDEREEEEVMEGNFFSRLLEKPKQWWFGFKAMSGKKKVVVIASVVIVVFGISVGFWVLIGQSSDSTVSQAGLENKNPVDIGIESPEEPRDHLSPLTGEMITRAEYENWSRKNS